MKYSNIVVAVDLSEESTKVLETARAIAKKTGARIHLVTVIKPLIQTYGGLNMAPIAAAGVSFEDEARQQAQAQLEALGEEFGVAREDIHVLVGSPAHEIRDLARSVNADLIVIGSHGRHGLGLLLGSTANAVLHDAGCNVLAVRLNYEDAS